MDKGLSDCDNTPRDLEASGQHPIAITSFSHNHTIRKGIQCLAPTIRPTAADIGWKVTNVIKNIETASLMSSGLMPTSSSKSFKSEENVHLALRLNATSKARK
jgi:hypothetical protein